MTSAPRPATAREAALQILSQVAVQPPLRVPIDSALGLVLAEELRSPVAIPFRTNSSMDGYAVRASDIRGASASSPVSLRVVETIPAGAVPARAIGPGECARIFTGAPLPEGADSVVRQEDTDHGTTTVRIGSDRDAGANVRFAGEDLAQGAVALAAGTALRPPHLGLLAAIGVAAPLVVRRPRVGILCGGDEIADVDRPEEIQSGRKVGSANTHTLQAQACEAGAEAFDLGVASDSVEGLVEKLKNAGDADLIVTAGGVSVGAHDHVRAAVAALGGAVTLSRARIRPGGPIAAGTVLGVPWIGLPGNPVSAMVTFELFARPAIRRMAGHPEPFRRARRVFVGEAFELGPVLQHFLRVTVADEGGRSVARLTGGQGSGILTSMARADALLLVPEGVHRVPAGTELDAVFLDEARHAAAPAF